MTKLVPRFRGFLPEGAKPPSDDVRVREQAPENKRSADGLLSVIGTEDRKQETDTERSPWRMICSLKITMGGNSVIGTGWFVGPSTVLTAGHCISYRGQKSSEIEVIPARDHYNYPFESVFVSAERMEVHERWETNQEQARDVGVLHLPGKPGLETGWFGIANASDDVLDSRLVNVGGYPATVFPGTAHERNVNGRELWWHRDAIGKLEPERIHYVVDTSGGQSGGPVFAYSNEDDIPIGLAVHAYGVSSRVRHTPEERNSATRIDKELGDLIEQWLKTSSDLAEQN